MDGKWEKEGGRDYIRHENTFEGGEYVYVDCGDGITGIHLEQNFSNCTF